MKIQQVNDIQNLNKPILDMLLKGNPKVNKLK